MLAIEGGAGMGGDIDEAQCLSAFRVEGIEFFATGKPHLLTVPSQAVHSVDTFKRPILTENFSG
ncbi:hypothetical protein D3C87_1245550 [compost metagenome]